MLVLQPNKTLAAQFANELRSCSRTTRSSTSSPTTTTTSPRTSQTDTYIEKDSSINEEVERLRHSATNSC